MRSPTASLQAWKFLSFVPLPSLHLVAVTSSNCDEHRLQLYAVDDSGAFEYITGFSAPSSCGPPDTQVGIAKFDWNRGGMCLVPAPPRSALDSPGPAGSSTLLLAECTHHWLREINIQRHPSVHGVDGGASGATSTSGPEHSSRLGLPRAGGIDVRVIEVPQRGRIGFSFLDRPEFVDCNGVHIVTSNWSPSSERPHSVVVLDYIKGDVVCNIAVNLFTPGKLGASPMRPFGLRLLRNGRQLVVADAGNGCCHVFQFASATCDTTSSDAAPSLQGSAGSQVGPAIGAGISARIASGPGSTQNARVELIASIRPSRAADGLWFSAPYDVVECRDVDVRGGGDSSVRSDSGGAVGASGLPVLGGASADAYRDSACSGHASVFIVSDFQRESLIQAMPVPVAGPGGGTRYRYSEIGDMAEPPAHFPFSHPSTLALGAVGTGQEHTSLLVFESKRKQAHIFRIQV